MTSTRPTTSTVNLVCSADDAFAMPLAVTIRSVLDHLDPARRLRLFVLNGDISARNKERLLRSWTDPRLSVEWLAPRREQLEGITGDRRISIASYYRILIPLLLPTDIDQVLYLDADLLVRRDIGYLWDEPFEGAHSLAVQDIGAPYLDSSRALEHFDRRSGWLAWPVPVPNFAELGLPYDAMYHNSGVLSINLALWRADNIARALKQCLDDNKEDVVWWDQYALNVVLCGKWRPLDPRWNQLSRIYKYPSWEQSPLDERAFHAVKGDPYIVHFTSIPKPWQPRCRHPYLVEYRACLDRTEWAGVRPGGWDSAKAWSAQQTQRVARGGRRLYRGARRLAGR